MQAARVSWSTYYCIQGLLRQRERGREEGSEGGQRGSGGHIEKR